MYTQQEQHAMKTAPFDHFMMLYSVLVQVNNLLAYRYPSKKVT